MNSGVLPWKLVAENIGLVDFPSLLAVTVTRKGVAVNSILGNTIFRVGFWGGCLCPLLPLGVCTFVRLRPLKETQAPHPTPYLEVLRIRNFSSSLKLKFVTSNVLKLISDH